MAALIGKLPTPEEYQTYVAQVDKTAVDTYRYLNFDQLSQYTEKADGVIFRLRCNRDGPGFPGPNALLFIITLHFRSPGKYVITPPIIAPATIAGISIINTSPYINGSMLMSKPYRAKLNSVVIRPPAMAQRIILLIIFDIISGVSARRRHRLTMREETVYPAGNNH